MTKFQTPRSKISPDPTHSFIRFMEVMRTETPGLTPAPLPLN